MTPVTAWAWEFWGKHRKHLLAIGGVFLAFALVYPKLCALAGLNLDSADVLQDITSNGQLPRNPEPFQIVRAIYFILLAFAPVVAMILSLLCVTFLFTFTEMDAQTREPLKFPARVFTLPVSTSFLFWGFVLTGMAAILLLYNCWALFVRLPHVDIFAPYQNWLGWMTLLALTQGMVWALAGWPATRMIVLTAVYMGFAWSPGRFDFSESPVALTALLLLGVALGRVGLQKMRHSQWQGWAGAWPVPTAARAELRGPKRFASPAQAQLWFEWRRWARRSGLCVAGLVLMPVGLNLLVRFAARLDPVQEDTLDAFTVCLLAMPLFVHFCFSLSPARAELPFLMLRPVTNGGLMMPAMKAAAISTVISWAAVFLALGGLTGLGDFSAVDGPLPLEWRIALVIGAIFLTWRVMAVNLWFAWSGKRWLMQMPVALLLAAYAVTFLLVLLKNDTVYWNRFLQCVPSLLAGLVVIKLLAAILAFGVSVKRRLLTPSALGGYLAVWMLLAVALPMTAVMLIHPSKEWALSMTLGVILLVPLARIGFGPIALSWNRHT